MMLKTTVVTLIIMGLLPKFRAASILESRATAVRSVSAYPISNLGMEFGNMALNTASGLLDAGGKIVTMSPLSRIPSRDDGTKVAMQILNFPDMTLAYKVAKLTVGLLSNTGKLPAVSNSTASVTFTAGNGDDGSCNIVITANLIQMDITVDMSSLNPLGDTVARSSSAFSSIVSSLTDVLQPVLPPILVDVLKNVLASSSGQMTADELCKSILNNDADISGYEPFSSYD